MSDDKVYQTLSGISKEELLNVIIDTVIFAQKNTGRKVASKLNMSPALFDYYIQKRKTGGNREK